MGRKKKTLLRTREEQQQNEKQTSQKDADKAESAQKNTIDATKILSESLLEQLGGSAALGENEANALVMPAKKEKKEEPKEKAPPVRILSKAKQRRIEYLESVKQKIAQRGDLFNELKEHSLSTDQLSLLHSTGTLGQKATKKQRLKRALQEERAGLQLSKEAFDELYHERNVKTGNPFEHKENKDDGDNKEENDDDEEDGDDDGDRNDAMKQSNNGNTKSGSNQSLQGKQENPVSVSAKLSFVNPSTKPNPSSSNSQSKPSLAANPQSKVLNKNTKAQPVQSSKKPATQAKQDTQSENPEKKMKTETVNSSAEAKPEKEQENAGVGAQSSSQPADSANTTPKSYILVDRPAEIIESRSKLPIIGEEQIIMESVMDNDISVICGETGSGKTTQIPQFLYEGGYGAKGLIGVTQPRRVAAVTMARRVAFELNSSYGKIVSHQIRYDTNVGKETAIKFMTDGILLKEIQQDFLLKKYSVIILDEAHERNLNTDVLIGLLSRIIPLRRKLMSEKKYGIVNPLKLLIMSATLRVEDFTGNANLFPNPPPVIQVDGRQHPVTIHFNKHTPLVDFVTEAYNKVCKIHRRLPNGGILVFLTGQLEIDTLCRKLRKKFSSTNPFAKGQTKSEASSEKNEDDEQTNEKDDRAGIHDLKDGMDDLMETKLEKKDDGEEESDEESACAPLYVLPLYSMLPTSQQLKVFEAVPEGARLCVVATNVAETSITIPGIKYVVDCGKVKERVYATNGSSSYEVVWISKASADQRAGRAGRVGPGHCYRLYSSAVYNDYFPQFSLPEIQRLPIDGVVLQMKSMGIKDVSTFPFPTSPDMSSIKTAIKTLKILGALHPETEEITNIGKTLAEFPVAPRYAKMLILGKQGGCLPYVIALVAALTVGNPFLFGSVVEQELEDELNEDEEMAKESGMEPAVDEKEARKALTLRFRVARQKFIHPGSDLLGVLRAIGAYEYAGCSELFCTENFLHDKSMKEIQNLRIQLSHLVSVVTKEDISSPEKLTPPSVEQEKLLQQIILAGHPDRVSRLVHETRSRRLAAYIPSEGDYEVYIHPTSNLSSEKHAYVVYNEIIETKRPYMKGVTAIDPKWLARLCPALCTIRKPLETPPPKYSADEDQIICFAEPSFGKHSWVLPVQPVTHPASNDVFKYFARALLEGVVISQFSRLESFLNAKPSIITNRKWTQNKITNIWSPLAKHRIASKAALIEIWKKDQKFLLSAVTEWYHADAQPILFAMWPPVNEEKPVVSLVEKKSKSKKMDDSASDSDADD